MYYFIYKITFFILCFVSASIFFTLEASAEQKVATESSSLNTLSPEQINAKVIQFSEINQDVKKEVDAVSPQDITASSAAKSIQGEQFPQQDIVVNINENIASEEAAHTIVNAVGHIFSDSEESSYKAKRIEDNSKEATDVLSRHENIQTSEPFVEKTLSQEIVLSTEKSCACQNNENTKSIPSIPTGGSALPSSQITPSVPAPALPFIQVASLNTLSPTIGDTLIVLALFGNIMILLLRAYVRLRSGRSPGYLPTK